MTAIRVRTYSVVLPIHQQVAPEAAEPAGALDDNVIADANASRLGESSGHLVHTDTSRGEPVKSERIPARSPQTSPIFAQKISGLFLPRKPVNRPPSQCYARPRSLRLRAIASGPETKRAHLSAPSADRKSRPPLDPTACRKEVARLRAARHNHRLREPTRHDDGGPPGNGDGGIPQVLGRPAVIPRRRRKPPRAP
jgi:hypothetical protein